MNFLTSKGEWGREWIHNVFLCRKKGLENCQDDAKKLNVNVNVNFSSITRMTMNTQHNLHCHYRRMLGMTQSRKCKILWFLYREKKNSNCEPCCCILSHCKTSERYCPWRSLLEFPTRLWFLQMLWLSSFPRGNDSKCSRQRNYRNPRKTCNNGFSNYLFQQPCSIKCASQKILLRA